MQRKKIYITRRINQKGIDLLESHKSLRTTVNPKNKILEREELVRAGRGASALVTLLTDKIDDEVMNAIGSNLKIIANYAVGFDNIDIEAAKRKNIVVTNTPEVMTQAVAEHAMALMLACARRLSEGDNFVKAGKYKRWEPDLLLGPEIAGKTLGIIGIGRIGSSLAQTAYHGFGMKIIYHDINRSEELERNLQADYASLKTLLERSDFVSLHVPLLPSTRHMIGKKEFKLMKDNAILVNTARGAVIDEKALACALKTKQIFAAGIDVFEFEPKPVGELMELDNIIMTPHIASATHEAREAMSECAAQNVIEVLSGREPLNPVWKD